MAQLGNSVLPVIDWDHRVLSSWWVLWSGGSKACPLTCLMPWRGWLEHWAESSSLFVSVTKYLEFLCGHLGFQD